MSDARDNQQRDEASPDYRREAHGIPAHMQAAAEAAGEADVASGLQDIGYASSTSGADAVHGSRLQDPEFKIQDSKFRIPLVAFDAHNPPSPELIGDCVHCGFCLPTCPTYLLWGEEMDSPRGRIHLMNLGNEGRAGMTDTFVRHFDQCLGCMACVTACPSGVQYDKLIESTRQQIDRRYERSLPKRLFRELVFQLFPYPDRLRILALPLWLYQMSGLQRVVGRILGGGLGENRTWRADNQPKIQNPGTLWVTKIRNRLSSLHDLMPPVSLEGLRLRVPVRTRPRGTPRARVGLLTGCVQRVFFSQVNAATIRVLAAEGCEVIAPPTQGCCGALALHAGREEDAKEFARKLITAFERYKLDFVAVNAAGCGSSMKEYGHLLRDDPQFAGRAAAFSSRVRDVTELLVELGPVAPRHPITGKRKEEGRRKKREQNGVHSSFFIHHSSLPSPLRVAYHDACHLAHAQGVRSQPRKLLEGIPGVRLVPVTEADICCGSAGIYNLVEPQPAAELGERKARYILETGAQVIASANPGCTLQIGAHLKRLGKPLPVLHPVELLDLSIKRNE